MYNVYDIVMDPVQAAQRLEHDSIIGYDSETTGLSPWRDKIALMQFYGEETGTVCVIQVRNGHVPEPICRLFKPGKLFIGHNVTNFDIPFLSTHGVRWDRAQWYDTLVGETVVTSYGRRNVRYTLKDSVRRKLSVNIDKSITHGHWDAEVLSEAQLQYAITDVLSLPALMRAQQETARETEQQDALDMEMSIMPAVAHMVINGLPVDPDILRQWVSEQENEAIAIARELRDVLGPINLNSPAQLLDAIKRTTGVVLQSTSLDTLVDVMLDSKAPEKLVWIAKKVLDYRKPAQRVKMYNEQWIREYIINGRIHPKFWQCSTDTSRFSCSEPNIQQWPKDARRVVGHLPGYKIVSNDFGQIEVRVAAEFARDEMLLRDLESADVHRAVARTVFGLESEDMVTADQRRRAKSLTFALLYDGDASTLYHHSRTEGGSLTFKDAVELERAFFNQYRLLAAMRAQARRIAATRRMTIIRLPNGLRRILVGEQNRAATIINTMVQGSAAVGLKYAIYEAYKHGLVENYLGAAVHDELVATVPAEHAEEYARELEICMLSGMGRILKHTVRVERKIGDFWQA